MYRNYGINPPATGAGKVTIIKLDDLTARIDSLCQEHELVRVSNAEVIVRLVHAPSTASTENLFGTLIGWIADGNPSTDPYNPAGLADLGQIENMIEGHFSSEDCSWKILCKPRLSVTRNITYDNSAAPGAHKLLHELTLSANITKLAKAAAEFADDPLRANDIIAGLSILYWSHQGITPGLQVCFYITYSIVDRPMRTFITKKL